MKIDLHIHTKTSSKSEKSTRNINDENKFKQIMRDANIQIAAITNHNEFDIDQYKKFKCKENSFLLLPGIEYDVEVPNDKKTQEDK